MKPLPLVLLGGLLAIAASCPAETAIMVDSGPHRSAEAAAKSETQVNWTNADATDDTVCTQCFAAVELQHYLRKMTGRSEDFRIVDDDAATSGDLILVGGPTSNAASRRLASALGIETEQLAKLGPEGYRIKSVTLDGRRVTLVAGGGRVGTLYAAYDLLYRLGCRWFAPGEAHEDLPGLAKMPEFDVTQRPDFLIRGFMAWEDRGNPDFFLWMARNRLNEWCIEQSNHPYLRKLGIKLVCGMHDSEWRFIGPGLPYPYDHPKFAGDENKPKDPYPVSDQYQGDADKDGKLSYFEAHPEWYALVGGKRIPGVGGWGGTNFCTSNRDACAEFIKNYVQGLVDGAYKGADIIRFWTLDGGKWCSCEQFRKLGIPTDRNLLLVYQLDKAVKKAREAGKLNRSIPIRHLVYADVLQPPTHLLPADYDYETCLAEFYPIGRCYVHNFDDPACATNIMYRRQLSGWATDPSRFYRGQICIGEYYNISGYRCLPICFMHTMAHDIPYYYHQTRARQFNYMHVTTGNWGSKALTNYQMARQLWDVGTDCPALWKDYFAGRYGPAGDTMRRFYESLEQMLCNATELKYRLAHQRLDTGAKELFPYSHLRYRREPGIRCDGPTLLEIVEHGRVCRRLITEALRLELPPRIRERVAEDEQCFTYAERTIGYYHACVEAFQLGRAGQRAEACRRYAEACRLAELLRQDTVSVALSYREGAVRDAFEASYATGALTHLAKLLGQKPPGAGK
jgi:hypothetical protein